MSRAQRAVVKLGMNGRPISPKEIFENVGIVDTDKYRQLVESLANQGILNREIPQNRANSLAKQKLVDGKSIGIYKITWPQTQSEKRTPSRHDSDRSNNAKIFVGGVDWHATEKEVEHVLSIFGDISEVVIPKNRHTGNSRGFAFVEFNSEEAAKKALESEEELWVNGRKIFLQAYRK